MWKGLILLAFLSSCITAEKCLQRFPPKEITENTIIYKDTIIKGATVRDTIPVLTTETIILRDTTGRAELRFYKDAYGRTVAQCAALDQIVQNFNKETIKEKTEIKEVKFVPWWLYSILGVTIFLSIVGLLRR